MLYTDTNTLTIIIIIHVGGLPTTPAQSLSCFASDSVLVVAMLTMCSLAIVLVDVAQCSASDDTFRESPWIYYNNNHGTIIPFFLLCGAICIQGVIAACLHFRWLVDGASVRPSSFSLPTEYVPTRIIFRRGRDVSCDVFPLHLESASGAATRETIHDGYQLKHPHSALNLHQHTISLCYFFIMQIKRDDRVITCS